MADIHVKYLGLDLKSPVMVSSCGLTADVEKVEVMEKNGAGAVVVKSLFEEQIRNEVEFVSAAGHDFPEMEDYVHAYIRQNSITGYRNIISSLKSRVSIPVIASINCYTPGEWVEYAREIEQEGADALELNLYDLHTDPMTSSEQIEQEYLKVVKSIASSVRIPVAVKISSHFTGLTSFVSRLQACGAKGVVIFNRFFTPDISLEKLELVPSSPLSAPEDYLQILRWTAVLSSAVKKMDIAVTTGVHTPESAVKQILAGASVVQICSVLYKEGLPVISAFNEQLKRFMEDHNFENLQQLRGRLDYSGIPDPAMYERVQFLKTFGGFR